MTTPSSSMFSESRPINMRAGFVDMHHLLPLKHYNPYRITNQRWQPPSFSSSVGKPAAVTTSLKSVCWDFRRHVMTKLISRRNKASIGNRDIGYNHTNVENRGESKLPVHLRCFRCCGHHLYDFSFGWHHSFNFKASDHYHFLNLQWTSASSNPRLWWWWKQRTRRQYTQSNFTYIHAESWTRPQC